MSVDPYVAETGQPYAFTGDDPVNLTDPLGLSRTSNKQYRTRIQGLEKKIEEHLGKLLHNPDSRDAAHWQKEIEAWQGEIERIQQRLPGSNNMIGVTQSAALNQTTTQWVPASQLSFQKIGVTITVVGVLAFLAKFLKFAPDG